MNYYYDVVLNFSDELINFYEWEESDSLEYFKKIPLVLVSSKQYKEILSHDIKVSQDFLESIKEKSKSNLSDSLYTVIFADKNGSTAIEFDESGKSILRSSLLPLDEVNIGEIIYTLNTKKINYEILKSLKYNDSLRCEKKLRLIIKTEINSLKRKNDNLKLKYLYMEWFNHESKSNDISLEMLESVDNESSETLYRLYDLIKLSYNNV
ncbi:uncharacterized protein BN733_00438 [Clostridium sp. CAG:609]|nr:uncharacterized protein BN733_00438 [Clostridium sp. CAG:609]